MNILITGSEGFIGKNLKEFLSKLKYNLITPKYQTLDLTNTKDVKYFFKNNKIECIINCATVEQVHKSYVTTVCDDNLKIFFNLLEYKSSNTKFINLGSGSEYNRNNWTHKMKENYFGKNIPEDSHSFSKYIQSKYIINSKNSKLYHLRIFGIFGKYEDYRYKFISNTIVKSLNSLDILIHKNCLYDYIYINDFCKIVNFFINNNTKDKIFNVTPSKSIDLISLAKIINEIINNKSKVKVLNKGWGKEYSGNNSLLLKNFNKIKFSSYKKSIEELIVYYESIKSKLDIKAIIQDDFLKYANKINPIKK